jgi:hypothetical protein
MDDAPRPEHDGVVITSQPERGGVPRARRRRDRVAAVARGEDVAETGTERDSVESSLLPGCADVVVRAGRDGGEAGERAAGPEGAEDGGR